MQFIFNTQPIPPFLLFLLPVSTSQLYSLPFYLSPHLFLFSPLPPNLLALQLPFISPASTLSLPQRLIPSACSRGISKQKMNKVPPEGTVAGLKGANSSVGGCRPCKGSRALAGETGVCGGCDCEGKQKKNTSLEIQLRILSRITNCVCMAVTH